jgi:hypothetical protein
VLKRKSQLKTNKPLKSKTHLKSKSRLSSKKKLGAGKKTHEWSKVRQDIYAELAEIGITSCEIRNEGCLGSFTLGLAHSLRRRFINTKEQLYETILACQKCHEYIDYKLSKDECESLIKSIIDDRK